MAKIGHIAIFTDLANVENLAAFYVDVFEMRVSRRSKSGSIFVTDGNIQVALLVIEACVGVDAETMGKRGKGIDHFGFTIEKSEEATIREKLAKHGVSLFQPPAGRAYIEDGFFDVDGNKVDVTSTGLRDIEPEAAPVHPQA